MLVLRGVLTRNLTSCSHKRLHRVVGVSGSCCFGPIIKGYTQTFSFDPGVTNCRGNFPLGMVLESGLCCNKGPFFIVPDSLTLGPHGDGHTLFFIVQVSPIVAEVFYAVSTKGGSCVSACIIGCLVFAHDGLARPRFRCLLISSSTSVTSFAGH